MWNALPKESILQHVTRTLDLIPVSTFDVTIQRFYLPKPIAFLSSGCSDTTFQNMGSMPRALEGTPELT